MPLFREFAGLNWDTAVPDETTILRFRRLLEEHKLAPQILALINELLSAKGLLLRAGTVVDATLIAAPSSTKNASGERDPQMKQSQKGNQWYFGMKAHIGVDADSGLVHTVRGMGCCRFQRHLVKVEYETGGGKWSREGNSAESSRLRR